jgi:hypothetical protein
LAGMWELIGSLGAVPRRLIWDNESGIGRRNSYAAGVAAFAGVLATRIGQVKPYDPESKGVVERARPRSCPHGPSPHRRISTPSLVSGSRWPIPRWSGGPGPVPRS